MLEVHVLVELFDALDVVGCQAEPGEQLELLETLHGDDGVVGQVQDLEVAQLGHLEHAQELVVLGRQLQEKNKRSLNFYNFLFLSIP